MKTTLQLQGLKPGLSLAVLENAIQACLGRGIPFRIVGTGCCEYTNSAELIEFEFENDPYRARDCERKIQIELPHLFARPKYPDASQRFAAQQARAAARNVAPKAGSKAAVKGKKRTTRKKAPPPTAAPAKNASRKNAKAPPRAAAARRTDEIQFCYPYDDDDDDDAKETCFFPPTISFDCTYANGIRIVPERWSVVSASSKKLTRCRAVYRSRDYCTATTATATTATATTAPVLNHVQARLWRQKFAATACVQRQFPAAVNRLLGTLTRRDVVLPAAAAQQGRRGTAAPHTYPPAAHIGRRPPLVAPAAARNMAESELACGLVAAPDLGARAAQIQAEWRDALQSGGGGGTSDEPAPWDKRGNLLATTVNDPNYVPVHQLLGWLRAGKGRGGGGATCEEDDGDLVKVLEACQDLSDPTYLWKIPLLTVYPVVTATAANVATTTKQRAKKKQKRETKTYTIRIGVYCHRLLAEATTSSLGVVMNALDKDSYVVTQPCIRPTTPATPTFESSPYPIVCVDDKDLLVKEKENETPEVDDDDDDDERKMPAKRNGPEQQQDEWMDCENDDSRVSAFTTKGLLKLLENCGTDTANFETNTVAAHRLASFEMDLMLHQKHAICWMLQMENLGGFGINSILWEERQFLDGGKYYFSPALGQLRLDRPARMLGGLLCDEMGLGKTIEVLGLILATLPDLKREAKREGKNHATLIIVPPSLVAQWQNEIVKATGNALTVDYLDFRTGLVTKRGSASEADIVLTTYNALERSAIVKSLNDELWGRIVLDEMQEIRSTTTMIAKNCEKLNCSRRWMLSGTPLFDGIDDLRGELNFLRVEPFAANSEDGFFKFMVSDPWEAHEAHAIKTLQVLSLVMLRRSKTMTIKATGAPLLGLKPLTVEFVPIQQTNSERALYYFLESVVSRELRSDTKDSSTRTCLRLLRELCNSAILLNGGLGAASQLKVLNQLLISDARRLRKLAAGNDDDGDEPKRQVTPIMSCDEAIMHLAQLQEATRAGENEVAELSLGFGQGLSRRSRAVDSVEQKRHEAQVALDEATMEQKDAKSKKAKALWHLALEKVTMGMLPYHCMDRAGRNFRCLWRWRSLTAAMTARNTLGRGWWRSLTAAMSARKTLPLVLLRGWRPCESLLTNLCIVHPEFFWSHKYSFLLECLPAVVQAVEVEAAIAQTLIDSGVCDTRENAQQSFRLNSIQSQPTTTTWKAGIVFFDKEVSAAVFRKATSANGIGLECASHISQIDDHIQATKEAYDGATSVYEVHPSNANFTFQNKTKKEYEKAKLGLRIVRCTKRNRAMHVTIRPAQGTFRSEAPFRSSALLEAAENEIERSSFVVATTATTIASESRKLQKLREISSSGVGEVVRAMSAFEQLQALSNGEAESTTCCVCLDYLGGGEQGPSNTTAAISMLKCGHLYCRGCLVHYISDKTRFNCPSCRREFVPKEDIVHIDPTKKEDSATIRARSTAAKTIVSKASRLLAQSHGRLPSELWEQLYLAIDEPVDSDNRRDPRVSALPRHFLAHLRACCPGLEVHASQTGKPRNLGRDSSCLSSKVKALLRDLPKDERSVVFSASKATIRHLETVLNIFGIGCRALFSGQKAEATERAVSEWQSSSVTRNGETIKYPVLLVQAGAAASGLTLTDACKMFLMEPFLRYSEEQQAYGRCHRFGQKQSVHVKCYYSPVSVESRLLEWRKLAAKRGTTVDAGPAAADQSTNVLYSTMEIDGDDNELEEEAGAEEENDQTRFLLGLENDRAGIPETAAAS